MTGVGAVLDNSHLSASGRIDEFGKLMRLAKMEGNHAAGPSVAIGPHMGKCEKINFSRRAPQIKKNVPLNDIVIASVKQA